jgi:hypothetical protein
VWFLIINEFPRTSFELTISAANFLPCRAFGAGDNPPLDRSRARPISNASDRSLSIHLIIVLILHILLIFFSNSAGQAVSMKWITSR